MRKLLLTSAALCAALLVATGANAQAPAAPASCVARSFTTFACCASDYTLQKWLE